MSSEERERIFHLEQELSKLRQDKAELLGKLRLERAKREMCVLLGETLAEPHAPADAAARFLAIVGSAFDFEGGWVLHRVGGADQPLACLAAFGPHREALSALTLEPGEGVAGWVAQHGATQVVTNPVKDQRFTADLGRKLGFEVHSILAVPIKRGGEPVGVVELFNKDDGRFTAADVEVVAAAAEHLAGLLQNAGILAAAESRCARQADLSTALAAFAAATTEAQVFSILVNAVTPVLGAQACALVRVGQPPEEWNLDQVLGEEEGARALWDRLRDDLATWVTGRGEAVRVADWRRDDRWAGGAGESSLPLTSLIAAPVKAHTEVVAVLEVLGTATVESPGQEGVGLAERLCEGTGKAVERCRAWDLASKIATLATSAAVGSDAASAERAARLLAAALSAARKTPHSLPTLAEVLGVLRTDPAQALEDHVIGTLESLPAHAPAGLEEEPQE